MNNIKNFNIQAFAKDILNQANKNIPSDISNNDKDFISDIIYKFCMLAGNALIQEENSNISTPKASFIVQTIAEWVFRKSIDITKANIPFELREEILQKVAFVVFDVSKKAIEQNLSQEETVDSIETHVKKHFKKIIEQLVQKGLLTEQKAQKVLFK